MLDRRRFGCNFRTMTSKPRRDQLPTETREQFVLRLLGGESIDFLSRESGLPRKQLSSWRRRFLAGGRAYLESRANPGEVERLRVANDELTQRLTDAELENELLNRRIASLHQKRSGLEYSHPYCSSAYAEAQREPDSTILAVPAWGTHLLVREGPGGKRLAVGGRPFASVDPSSDLPAGLEYLQREGISSVSLVTDPMWSPEHPALEQAFGVCRHFKETYLVDRADPLRISKRHRNRINNARQGAVLEEISFSEHLDKWLELYRHNVANRQIAQPFSESYSERLGALPGLRTLAVRVDGEIVTITTWVRYRDTLYFHDAASSPEGHTAAASYVAFSHVIGNFTDCRYVFLGGAAEYFDNRLDGLARFKRGFSNRSTTSYLCSAILTPLPVAA
jgi:hypothetical protein